MSSWYFLYWCVLLQPFWFLMQEGRSQGLGAIAGAAETYWGKNKGRSMEGNLVKWTKILTVVFFLLAIVLNLDIF